MDAASQALVAQLQNEQSIAYGADLIEKYGPKIAGGILGMYSGDIYKGAKRKLSSLFGYGRPAKRRRLQGPRLPRYQKGTQRVSGFYGRFKPTFGKELKFFDTNINFLTSNDEWKHLQASDKSLNVVGRGTGPSQRNGRNFTIRSLNFRFFISRNEGIESLTFRLMVILDTQANGEVPTKEQIFAVPVSTSTQLAWTSYRNLENISRFVVLWDKTYTMNSYNSITGGVFTNNTVHDSYYKKIAVKTEMSGTAEIATFTDIKDNSITLWACSSSPSTSSARITGSFRIRFTG